METDWFAEQVQELVSVRLCKVTSGIDFAGDLAALTAGKMLRSRLAARLVSRDAVPVCPGLVAAACAATEMAHTASLFHDDVIDGGLLRRGEPTLWRATGPSAAVLIGDVLLCEAIDLLIDTKCRSYVRAFVSKIKEVCAAEAEQELVLRSRELSQSACLRVARAKTGPLFAFIGYVCGGEDAELSSALEEAGYQIGAAYQLADDLIDVTGDERVAGKTLGTDKQREKPTIPVLSAEGGSAVRNYVSALCRSALAELDRWPPIRRGVAEFLSRDLQPVFDRHAQDLNVTMRKAI